MKNKIIGSLLLLLTLSLSAVAQQLTFQSAADMQQYFTFMPGKKIISGHRGTRENGLPENSIPALKAVLKKTPAIFEVDPRYTKDSVAVMIHDATLDRTTTGKGKVADYSWKELRKLRLKNAAGEVTNYKINTLDELIKWAKGKTILNLDKKDIPPAKIAEIIRKHQAYPWVWVTVHSLEEAAFHLAQHPDQYLSMHLRTIEAVQQFIHSGLSFNRMIVYIGPEIKVSNQSLYQELNSRGVLCMISASSSYDKLGTKELRQEKFKQIFADGASILETDFPMEAAEVL